MEMSIKNNMFMKSSAQPHAQEFGAVKDDLHEGYFETVSNIDPSQYARLLQARAESSDCTSVDPDAFTRRSIEGQKSMSHYLIESNESPEKLAAKIIDVTQKADHRLGRRLNPEERRPFEQTILLALTEGAPIEFVLLGSAFKINNPFKTAGDVSDTAELAALLHIRDFLNEIAAITPHQVHFNCLWEGAMYQQCAGVGEAQAARCYKKIKHFLEILEDPRIRIFDLTAISHLSAHIHQLIDECLDQTGFLVDLMNNAKARKVSPLIAGVRTALSDSIGNPDPSHFASFAQTHEPPADMLATARTRAQALEKRISWFRDMAREASAQPTEDHPLFKDYARYIAVTKLVKAKSNFELSFPKRYTVRLTSRPRAGAIGFSVIGGRKALLPHHGVGVFSPPSLTVRHMVELVMGRDAERYRPIVANDDTSRSPQIIAFETI